MLAGGTGGCEEGEGGPDMICSVAGEATPGRASANALVEEGFGPVRKAARVVDGGGGAVDVP